jgi:sigma-B regulation protein RsbU (phosphoserine phosphatase)
MAPVQAVIDSTLEPVLGASYSMILGSARDSALADSLAALPDSLAEIAAPERAVESLRRESERIRAEAGEPRDAGRGGRHVRFSRSEPGEPVVVGAGNDRATGAAVAFRGMAIVTGPELSRRRWHPSQYMLTASADLRTTLIGLYANVRENPLQAVPIALLGTLVLLLLPVAWTDFTMVGRMGRSIAEAVGALRDGAAALGKGDLGHRIAIKGHDDLWDTARHFNTMAEGLERARALEKERDRLESELELARRIQQRLLPEGPPDVPGLEIAGRSEPAREVGGDYYDHFDLGGGSVLLVIADVSGKGVPAALLMSGFRASLMSQDAHSLGPERLAARVNEFLHRSVETGKFVTAFLGFLDAASGRLVYANAGHNPPALLRRDGRVDWLAAGGVVLGILPQFRFESGETTLEHGDLLALYTDGVTEGADAAGELWGEERLVAALRRLADLPCADAGEALVREVRAYEGETGPADDITVLLARRVPKSGA